MRPELAPPGTPYPARTPDGGYRPDRYPPSRGYPPGGAVPGGSLPGGYPPGGYPPDEHHARRPAGPVNGPGPAGYHEPPAAPRPVSYPAPQAPAPQAPAQPAQQAQQAQQAPRAPAPPAPEPLPVPEPGTFVYRDSDGPDEPEDAGIQEADGAYGPDDPAYGPPDPSWYDRQREEDEAARRQAEELQHARGPFEPMRHVDGAGQGYYAEASYQALDDEAPASSVMAGEDEDDRGAALGEAALAQIKDLYMTAEAIGEEDLGRHYERLLERQQQLISEYFKDSGFGASGVSQVSVSGENPQ